MNIKINDKQDVKNSGKDQVSVAEFSFVLGVWYGSTASETRTRSHSQWDVEQKRKFRLPNSNPLFTYCFLYGQGDHDIYL